jgi:hypothetical protein
MTHDDHVLVSLYSFYSRTRFPRVINAQIIIINAISPRHTTKQQPTEPNERRQPNADSFSHPDRLRLFISFPTALLAATLSVI